jgi:hypothetical protein
VSWGKVAGNRGGHLSARWYAPAAMHRVARAACWNWKKGVDCQLVWGQDVSGASVCY